MSPSRRVLIVEDNKCGRETLRLVLESWGHEVEVAADGFQGIQKALKWEPDAAVIDIGLPQCSGHQVARQLRAALNGRIRLIALTAYSHEETRAFAAGFDDFLTKPA